MFENRSMMILKEPGEIYNNHGDVAKTISFKLDIIGRPTRFSICVAQKQARLSDITPLARMLSTKLAIIVLDKLHSNGEFVPCRKGCSACCNYLIPLSVPETFRLREEVLAMPTEQGRAVSQSFLDTAKIILNEKPKKFEINESAETSCQIQINQLSKWYASLKLACPFLSNNLCTSYEHRPIACREHIVTDSALLCDDERSDESQIVQIPISILHCLWHCHGYKRISNVASGHGLPSLWSNVLLRFYRHSISNNQKLELRKYLSSALSIDAIILDLCSTSGSIYQQYAIPLTILIAI